MIVRSSSLTSYGLGDLQTGLQLQGLEPGALLLLLEYIATVICPVLFHSRVPGPDTIFVLLPLFLLHVLSQVSEQASSPSGSYCLSAFTVPPSLPPPPPFFILLLISFGLSFYLHCSFTSDCDPAGPQSETNQKPLLQRCGAITTLSPA